MKRGLSRGRFGTFDARTSNLVVQNLASQVVIQDERKSIPVLELDARSLVGEHNTYAWCLLLNEDTSLAQRINFIGLAISALRARASSPASSPATSQTLNCHPTSLLLSPASHIQGLDTSTRNKHFTHSYIYLHAKNHGRHLKPTLLF